MQEGFLTFEENKIRCLRIDGGEKVMIGFHGFGLDASSFIPLANLLVKEYTFLSLDFPGNSAALWKSKKMPDEKVLSYFIERICEDFKVDKVALIGYSMGARPVLSMVGFIPEKIEKLVLLAPDGLRKNIWYYLATHSFYGRLIFKNIVRKPLYWLHHLERLVKKGIVKKRWHHLTKNVFSDDALRQKLLVDWPFTKNFIPHRRFVQKKLRQYNIPVHIFMGGKDVIFPPKEGRDFIKHLPEGQVHVLNCGHDVLNNSVLNRIATEL